MPGNFVELKVKVPTYIYTFFLFWVFGEYTQ